METKRKRIQRPDLDKVNSGWDVLAIALYYFVKFWWAFIILIIVAGIMLSGFSFERNEAGDIKIQKTPAKLEKMNEQP